METQTFTKKRSFNLSRISEEEGLVLRTLLNLNEIGVEEKLQGDESYWSSELTLTQATAIGCELCDRIMGMVDRED